MTTFSIGAGSSFGTGFGADVPPQEEGGPDFGLTVLEDRLDLACHAVPDKCGDLKPGHDERDVEVADLAVLFAREALQK